jgi:hypothetical protein
LSNIVSKPTVCWGLKMQWVSPSFLNALPFSFDGAEDQIWSLLTLDLSPTFNNQRNMDPPSRKHSFVTDDTLFPLSLWKQYHCLFCFLPYGMEKSTQIFSSDLHQQCLFLRIIHGLPINIQSHAPVDLNLCYIWFRVFHCFSLMLHTCV